MSDCSFKAGEIPSHPSFQAVSDQESIPVRLKITWIKTHPADLLNAAGRLNILNDLFNPTNKATVLLMASVYRGAVRSEGMWVKSRDRQTDRPPSGRVIAGFPAMLLLIKAERASSND